MPETTTMNHPLRAAAGELLREDEEPDDLGDLWGEACGVYSEAD